MFITNNVEKPMTQIPQTDNTQHLQETVIYDRSGNRTQNSRM